MFLRIIIRDDVKKIVGETTDTFLEAVDSIFYSPIYEIENESEIENLKNSFVVNCTKVRKPMIQLILAQTAETI